MPSGLARGVECTIAMQASRVCEWLDKPRASTRIELHDIAWNVSLSCQHGPARASTTTTPPARQMYHWGPMPMSVSESVYQHCIRSNACSRPACDGFPLVQGLAPVHAVLET